MLGVRGQKALLPRSFLTRLDRKMALSWFDANLSLVRPYTSTADDVYTKVILTMHAPRSAS